MRRVFLIVLLGMIGCGYTTRGFVYEEESIYIKPIINSISITHETRQYQTYTTYPVLIEKKLTNELAKRFSIDGHLTVANETYGALELQGEVRNYTKEALRYAGDDTITEQRLRLFVTMVLLNAQGNTIKEKEIVGETTFFLSGSLAKSETQAQAELVEDAARRMVETVIENW